MNPLYNMIEARAENWVNNLKADAHQSLVKNIIAHIEVMGKLRVPQQQAIKIYLWIKFVAQNQKLSDIIKQGLLHDEQIVRQYDNYRNFGDNYTGHFLNQFFQDNKQKNLHKKLVNDPNGEQTNWDDFLGQLLHDFQYPNYLYSLPMGAGKTFLMACFIYLDLYFANLFKQDKRFAHNFIVFAPHASKTAILPSLKTIQNFKPEWILPSKDAANIKHLIHFEILDALSSKRRDKLHGNNPNLEKVNRLKQTYDFGLVFITNAEKVVLEKYSATDHAKIEELKRYTESVFDDQSTTEQIKKTNALRESLSSLPNLTVILDEVHHAYGEKDTKEKKIRQALSVLNQHNNLTTVLGMSGTPYVKHSIKIGDASITMNQIQDIVYYYPLNEGIGRFLKNPVIKKHEVVESEFLRSALTEFFTNYDKQYANGAKSKIAFYCPKIEDLNEQVLPVIRAWYKEHRPHKEDEIFCYYSKTAKNQKQYALPKDSNAVFNNLDQPYSSKRVILLVAIGKEGWDCRSLTAVVLPREVTTTNFVLQTTCRCLREVDDATTEGALIYLSAKNYEILDNQLKSNYQLSISDLSRQDESTIKVQIHKQHLGKLQYKQVEHKYSVVKRVSPSISESLDKFDAIFKQLKSLYKYEEQGITAKIGKGELVKEQKEIYQLPSSDDIDFTYRTFLHQLCRVAYRLVSESELHIEYADKLRKIHKKIAANAGWIKHNPHIDFSDIIAAIAASFMDSVESTKHISASTTDIELLEWTGGDNQLTFLSPGGTVYKFMPRLKYSDLRMYQNYPEEISKLIQNIDPNDISFNYAPYKMDSGFEQNALQEMLKLAELKDLEMYFNGYKNDKLQSFWIQTPNGKYTPDFLILKRSNGKPGVGKKPAAIEKVLIIETKGKPYYNDQFKAKEKFVHEEFIKHNPNFKYHCYVDEDGKNDFVIHLNNFRQLLRDF